MLSFVSVISYTAIASIIAPLPDSGHVAAASMNTSAEVARGVLTTASRHVGTRYRFGGTKPGAFDCSGFVRYVFRRHGLELPRTARDQSAVGHPVAIGADTLRVGDLLFFRTRRGSASHVAIYAGGGRIIHASAGSRRVRYDDLDSARGRWFIEHLSSVRRVITGAGNRELGAGQLRTGATVRAGD